MAIDTKLRNYLLTTVVGVLITAGGCYSKAVNADIETLKRENTKRQVETSTTKQAVDDFRNDFDDFKHIVLTDISRHHSGNR